MAVLIISTATESYTYELPTEVGAAYNIGSGADCHISLPGVPGLAELHCSVTCMEDGYVITDAGSPGGTLAFDRKVESEYMSPEIVYTVGELTLAIAESAAAEEAAAEEGAPATKKTTKKTVTRAAKKGSALTLDELKAAAAKFDRNKNKNSKIANLIYIIVVLLAAFYAGVALHHWQTTGNCLPGLLPDPEPPAEESGESSAEGEEEILEEE